MWTTGSSDAEHSDRSIDVALPETVEEIHDMVLPGRKLKVRVIIKPIDISQSEYCVTVFDRSMKKVPFH